MYMVMCNKLECIHLKTPYTPCKNKSSVHVLPENVIRIQTTRDTCMHAGTQSAWWQILNFPIIDSNVRLETVGLEKSTSTILHIPTTDAASKAGHRLEMPDW